MSSVQGDVGAAGSMSRQVAGEHNWPVVAVTV
jgi:hypothetical protein